MSNCDINRSQSHHEYIIEYAYEITNRTYTKMEDKYSTIFFKINTTELRWLKSENTSQLKLLNQFWVSQVFIF